MTGTGEGSTLGGSTPIDVAETKVGGVRTGSRTSITADLFDNASKDTAGVLEESSGVCQYRCSTNFASPLMVIVREVGL
ncbi:unnamed protein product [Sphagnum jensenii]|uniref:Uncharacterized protein n=1 Tax=Sphagnum jensenii TaxID=128206 RepID=A0ABP0WEG2_9BRYO